MRSLVSPLVPPRDAPADRRPRAAARRERGSMTPILAGSAVALALMAIGGATVGRLAAVRLDVQRASDAAVLAAAQIIKERGLPFDDAARMAAENLARRNSRLPVTFTWTINDAPTALEFSVAAQATVDVPRMIFMSGSTTVSARARGRVTQAKFDEATRRLPKLMLVLDYSGSMNQIMPGSGGKSAIRVLKESVTNLLDAGLMVDYGLAIFASGLEDQAPIGTSVATLKAKVNGRNAGGMTCTSCGLNRARELLLAAGEDTGRYVLLVSDGAPNNGGGANGARAAATSIWNNPTAGTIFTLHIDWSGGADAALRNFMISVSGTPASRGDVSYYYRATDANTLRDTFRNIVASIVCSVGPLVPAPAAPSSLRVYLKDRGSGVERLIPAVADLAANAAIEAYRYDAPTATLRLTQTACNAVLDLRQQVVVRHGQAGLVE